jgi:integrase
MSGSRRRAPGEGTYEQLPSGLYRLVVKISGKRIKGPARETRLEAREALRRKLEGAKDEGSPSLSSLAQEWTNMRAHNLSPTTVETYRKWTKSLEADPIGSMIAVKITEHDLRRWHSRQTIGSTSARKRLGWIQGILRTVGNHVRYAPPKAQGHLRRPLSPEEVKRVRAALVEASDLERMAVLVCLELGLRKSEACGLRHEDRDGHGVRIKRTVVRLTGEIRVKAKAKTAKSAGWVPLSPTLDALIGPPRTGYVVPGTSPKEPCYPDTFERAVKRILAKAKVSVPYGGPHALRRTYGMMMLEAGVDVVTAAECMRHDPAILLREYSRSRTDLKRSAVLKTFGEGPTGGVFQDDNSNLA